MNLENFVEDEMLESAVNASDVERLLSYKNLKFTTDQLLHLYNKGHKTAVMSSDKVTRRFIEVLDLSKEWYNYTPLYTNRRIPKYLQSRIIERFEEVQPDNSELLLRAYLSSSMPLTEALSRVRELKISYELSFRGDIFVEHRFDDVVDVLSKEDSSVKNEERWELTARVEAYGRALLSELHSS